jgi:hypothetical protein
MGSSRYESIEANEITSLAANISRTGIVKKAPSIPLPLHLLLLEK